MRHQRAVVEWIAPAPVEWERPPADVWGGGPGHGASDPHFRYGRESQSCPSHAEQDAMSTKSPAPGRSPGGKCKGAEGSSLSAPRRSPDQSPLHPKLRIRAQPPQRKRLTQRKQRSRGSRGTATSLSPLFLCSLCFLCVRPCSCSCSCRCRALSPRNERRRAGPPKACAARWRGRPGDKSGRRERCASGTGPP
jgi:hypothetical protein